MTHAHTPGPLSNDPLERLTLGAMKAARIIMNDHQRIHTLYGSKSVEGIADLIDRETQAPAMREALKELYAVYCDAMASEYDYPDNPWSPERNADKVALKVRALLAQIEG